MSSRRKQSSLIDKSGFKAPAQDALVHHRTFIGYSVMAEIVETAMAFKNPFGQLASAQGSETIFDGIEAREKKP